MIILILMLFAHIVDDYYLQGVLAKMKQKKWWEENSPNPLFKNDYKMALFEHALSWSIMISLPIIFLGSVNEYTLFSVIVVNALLHAQIDNLKANKGKINLIQDQLLHFAQVIITWIIFMNL